MAVRLARAMWKHIRETVTDPETWRDVTKDLIKGAIKWTLGGGFILLVVVWATSKLDPTVAAVWAKLTGAFGPAWQALWKPLGVPRVLLGIALLYAVWRAVERWRPRRKVRPILQVVEPQPATGRYVRPMEPPPPPVPPLDDRQTRALHILYMEHPGSIALGRVAGNIGYSYGRAEQLFEELQQLQLVRVTPNPWHGTQVSLTKRGRDFCIERGIAPR